MVVSEGSSLSLQQQKQYQKVSKKIMSKEEKEQTYIMKHRNMKNVNQKKTLKT